MSIEERLEKTADRYRALGYKVVLRPVPADLPAFAKDFKVEVVATSDSGNVLVVAKPSPSDLEADSEVPRYSEVTSQQPGWRMDVLVLGPDLPLRSEKRDAKEPSDGSEDLLTPLDGRPETYQTWAVEYYGRDVDLAAVQPIYRRAPLTQELVDRLNPDLTLVELLADITEIGYPVAGVRS